MQRARRAAAVLSSRSPRKVSWWVARNGPSTFGAARRSAAAPIGANIALEDAAERYRAVVVREAADRKDAAAIVVTFADAADAAKARKRLAAARSRGRHRFRGAAAPVVTRAAPAAVDWRGNAAPVRPRAAFLARRIANAMAWPLAAFAGAVAAAAARRWLDAPDRLEGLAAAATHVVVAPAVVRLWSALAGANGIQTFRALTTARVLAGLWTVFDGRPWDRALRRATIRIIRDLALGEAAGGVSVRLLRLAAAKVAAATRPSLRLRAAWLARFRDGEIPEIVVDDGRAFDAVATDVEASSDGVASADRLADAGEDFAQQLEEVAGHLRARQTSETTVFAALESSRGPGSSLGRAPPTKRTRSTRTWPSTRAAASCRPRPRGSPSRRRTRRAAADVIPETAPVPTPRPRTRFEDGEGTGARSARRPPTRCRTRGPSRPPQTRGRCA